MILIGHLEEDRTKVPDKVQLIKDQFYQWLHEQGAIVIHRDKLTFQEVIDQYYSDEHPNHRQGPFIRMDIPNIIQEHKLFDVEGICQHNDVVLYTDCDVLFMEVSEMMLEKAKNLVSGSSNNTPIVAYGPEHIKKYVLQHRSHALFCIQFWITCEEYFELWIKTFF